MSDLCTNGMFNCVFDAVFGFGLAVLALIFIAAMMGLFDKD